MTSAAVVTIFGATITTILVTANQLVGQVSNSEVVVEDMKWGTLPFVGAMFAGLMAFMFRPDDWRKTVGRLIGAAVVGVGLPRVATYFHPWLKEWSLDPIILIGAGFVSGLIGYAIAKWAVDWSLKRAPEIAELGAEDWTHRKIKNARKHDPPSQA